MIEINVRLKIDTNDPREAYLQAKGSLSFSGHKFEVSDYWIVNGKPMPKCIAQAVKGTRPCSVADISPTADPGLRNVLEDLHELCEEFTDPEEVTHCVTPTDWRDDLRRTLRNVKPSGMREAVEAYNVPDAMVAFNALILDGLPDGMEVVAADNKAEIHRINVLPNAGGARDIDEEITNLFGCLKNASEPFGEVDFDVGYADRLSDLDETSGSHSIDLDIPMDATDIEIAELLAQTIPGNRIGRYFEILKELPVFEERPLRTKIGTYFDVTTWMWVANAVIPYRVSND